MFAIGSLTVVLLAGDTSGGARAPRPIADVLFADGPLASLTERMTLYDSLLGDWDMDVVDYDTDGSRRSQKGEWHFSWVLEGRAIQDVLIVPPRGSRDGGPKQGNRYGTTLRVYDPAAGTPRAR